MVNYHPTELQTPLKIRHAIHVCCCQLAPRLSQEKRENFVEWYSCSRSTFSGGKICTVPSGVKINSHRFFHSKGKRSWLSLEKSFLPACRVLQTLVTVDDVRSRTKANARHGWLRAAQGSIG